MPQTLPTTETDPSESGNAPLAVVIDLDIVRLKASLPGIVSRCMDYSAAPRFDVALIDAVQAFYGIDVDVATAETDILEDDAERVRFFPWFLWEWRSEAHTETIGAAFARESQLSSIDKRLVAALSGSRVWFWEVRSVTKGRDASVQFQEILGRRKITVRDHELAEAVTVGEILQARIIHVRNARRAVVHLVDAIYVSLPACLRGELVARLHDMGIKNVGALAETGGALSPELMELAEELLDDALGIVAEDYAEDALCTLRIAAPFTDIAPLFGHSPDISARAFPTTVGRDAVHVVIEDRDGDHALCHFVGSHHVDSVRTSLAARALSAARFHGERPLNDTVTGWLTNGAIPAWAKFQPAIVAEISHAADDWAITFSELIHPSLGRRPRDAVEDAWTRRSVESMLDRLEATLPVQSRNSVATVRRSLGLAKDL